MKIQPKFFPLFLPASFLAVAVSIIFSEVVYELATGGWVRNELYGATLFNLVVFISLAVDLHRTLKSEKWLQKYVMSAGILVSLIFYYWASLSNDPAFPTLAGLALFTLFRIAPALVMLKLLLFLMSKYVVRDSVSSPPPVS